VLRIDALPLAHDPLVRTLALDMPIGLLGIQPHTRRRNRMNGRVIERHATGFTVQVGHSFGNCPKYIQEREPIHAPQAGQAASVDELAALDDDARRLIGGADTFFIATSHPRAAGDATGATHGVDVSHRGGPPGFVEIGADGRLVVPDFVGNSFFNTLGNLQLQPRCGLLFIGFETGELLYVAARGELEWQGNERRLHLEPTQAVRTRGTFPLRWR
jgi:predicted pyridoxine 5'-phosphate oxidase superfamily flavin-nucleotide-binding protein